MPSLSNNCSENHGGIGSRCHVRFRLAALAMPLDPSDDAAWDPACFLSHRLVWSLSSG